MFYLTSYATIQYFSSTYEYLVCHFCPLSVYGTLRKVLLRRKSQKQQGVFLIIVGNVSSEPYVVF